MQSTRRDFLVGGKKTNDMKFNVFLDPKNQSDSKNNMLDEQV